MYFSINKLRFELRCWLPGLPPFCVAKQTSYLRGGSASGTGQSLHHLACTGLNHGAVHVPLLVLRYTRVNIMTRFGSSATRWLHPPPISSFCFLFPTVVSILLGLCLKNPCIKRIRIISPLSIHLCILYTLCNQGWQNTDFSRKNPAHSVFFG